MMAFGWPGSASPRHGPGMTAAPHRPPRQPHASTGPPFGRVRPGGSWSPRTHGV